VGLPTRSPLAEASVSSCGASVRGATAARTAACGRTSNEISVLLEPQNRQPRFGRFDAGHHPHASWSCTQSETPRRPRRRRRRYPPARNRRGRVHPRVTIKDECGTRHGGSHAVGSPRGPGGRRREGAGSRSAGDETRWVLVAREHVACKSGPGRTPPSHAQRLVITGEGSWHFGFKVLPLVCKMPWRRSERGAARNRAKSSPFCMQVCKVRRREREGAAGNASHAAAILSAKCRRAGKELGRGCRSGQCGRGPIR
jgi:hypothetical protein